MVMLELCRHVEIFSVPDKPQPTLTLQHLYELYFLPRHVQMWLYWCCNLFQNLLCTKVHTMFGWAQLIKPEILQTEKNLVDTFVVSHDCHGYPLTPSQT